MKSEPVPRVPRRRRPAKKRQRNGETDAGRRPKHAASHNQSSRYYNERTLKQRTLLTDRTHQRTVSRINAEKTKFSRTMNRQETDLLNRLMELEACLPKFQSDTDSADNGKTDKLDKVRTIKLPSEEQNVPTAPSNYESSSSEEHADKLKTLSSQPKNSSSQHNDRSSAETTSAQPELESQDVQNSAEPGRLSPLLEQAEEDSSSSTTPALPSIPSKTTATCVVCESGKTKPPDTEHPEVTKSGTDEANVRLPQIDQLSEEEKSVAKLNPGLPRSLLRARVRKRSISQLPTSSNPNYHVHFPDTERKDSEGHSSNDGKSRDEKKYPLERSVHHLPPIETDRAYGRRTWPGSAIELVGTNGYTSGIMPKVMQANYNTHLYDRDGREGGGDRLPTVIRSRALIRREQKKPSKDMYVWLGLDSKYQLRLMTNPKSVSHTDKS
ncbi:hypothetical protein Bbelb_329950 [Branchiostoma belcheri]|nr:hypothetical protein Bbelb_329950 [Branchiostoma belcheri]